MNIFDILGPIMVGPSSSHTAGAVRIGYAARKLLSQEPEQIEMELHGSFAATGKGHGTDKALVAGLLGMNPDDMDIPRSFEIAKERGVSVGESHVNIRGAHPNTVRLKVKGGGNAVDMEASSLGGGRIRINKIDGIETGISGESPTLIIMNQDKPGCVAEVSKALAENQVNIATMQLYRSARGGNAVMVVEVDQHVSKEIRAGLREIDGIQKVTYVSIGER